MFGIGNPELGVIMLGLFVLFIMFGVYALSGPIGWSWMKLRRRPRDGGAAGKGG